MAVKIDKHNTSLLSSTETLITLPSSGILIDMMIRHKSILWKQIKFPAHLTPKNDHFQMQLFDVY